jgi:hypothetical protein
MLVFKLSIKSPRMLQQVSFVIIEAHWDVMFSLCLHLAFCLNGKSDGIKVIWAGALIRSLLVCGSSSGFQVWFSMISKLISNHTRVKAHRNRINIVIDALCGSGCDYETVDHILWRCPYFQSKRVRLMAQLSSVNLSLYIRDLLASHQWSDVRAYLSFLTSIDCQIRVQCIIFYVCVSLFVFCVRSYFVMCLKKKILEY